MPRSEKPRRVEVVLDGPPTPAWQQRALEELEASSLLEVVAVRLAGAVRRSRGATAVEAIERKLFRLGPAALGPSGVEPVLGSGELTVWLAENAPVGSDVLSLRHSGRAESAERAFRRAALRGEPVVQTEAVLGGRVVERTVSGARPFSTTLSRDRALWKLDGLVRRAAERAPGLDEPAATAPSGRRAPVAAELVARMPARWLRIVSARALYVRPWQVRVRVRETDPVAGWAEGALTLPWRPGHLYADPMLFEHEGRHHLFCEDLPPGSKLAVISHTELHPDGTCDPPEPVLSLDYHLSYPFVFAHEGEIFMIPETSAQRRVELYRAVEFPHRWEHAGVLLEEVTASDATVRAHDGLLWMFVGIAAPHATLLDELHLYSARSPLGPWQPHPANPVVSDVGRGRPAGAIQEWQGRLVRPAQDGSRRYGGAVSFQQIEDLTPERYREHEIARIDPPMLGGKARATHTYTADSRFEAVDLRERSARLASLLRRDRPSPSL